MKRVNWRKVTLIAALAFLCLGGLSGAIPMLLKPDGSILGMSTSLLQNAPVHTYFWPGIFILLCMSVWPIVTIAATLRHSKWAFVSTVLLGAATMAWIVYETIIMRTFNPLQPAILLTGAIIIYCGFSLRQL